MRRLFTAQGIRLLAEYTVTSLLSLVISFLALRHYTPLEFGIMARVQAEVAIFSVLLTLALDTPLLNRLVAHSQRGVLLGTSLMLRTGGMVLTLVASSFIAVLGGQDMATTLPWLLMVLVPQAVSAANVFSILLFQDNALGWLIPARVVIALVFSMLRIAAINANWSFAAFNGLAIIEALALFGVSYWVYHRKRYALKLRFCLEVALDLLKEAWPLIVSSFVITLFFKLDLYIVSLILPYEKIAQYSAAQRIVECYAAALAILLNQYYIQLIPQSPAEKLKGIATLFRSAYLLCALILLGHYTVARPILMQFFGEKYAEGISLSVLLCGSLLFNIGGTVRGYLFVFEGLNKYHLPSALLGVATLVVITYPAVTYFGLTGAVVSLIAAQGVSVFVSSFCFSPVRRYAHLFWSSPAETLLQRPDKSSAN